MRERKRKGEEKLTEQGCKDRQIKGNVKEKEREGKETDEQWEEEGRNRKESWKRGRVTSVEKRKRNIILEKGESNKTYRHFDALSQSRDPQVNPCRRERRKWYLSWEGITKN